MVGLHVRIGHLFSGFCLVMLGWHILTPGNPHHVYNLFLHVILGVTFLVSSFSTARVCRFLHPAALFFGASLTAWAGNFPVAAVISFVAMMLYYSYGGFRSVTTFRVLGSFFSLFTMFFVAAILSGYNAEYAQAYAVALVWTVFSLGLFWSFWTVLQYFASDIITQNRDLLELNKKLSKGDCADVATKRG